MNYCSNCGEQLVFQIPQGDDRPRFVCTACASVHYSNPKMVVGSIPESNGKILLCRRAIEPRLGKWTLPAGYLENGETVSDCAKRDANHDYQAGSESLEVKLYRPDDIPWSELAFPVVHEVLKLYCGDLVSGDFPFRMVDIDQQLGVGSANW
jgi:hypothetical protein